MGNEPERQQCMHGQNCAGCDTPCAPDAGENLLARLATGATGLRLVRGSPTMLSDLCAELESEANERRRLETMADALLAEIKRQDGFIMDVNKLAAVAIVALAPEDHHG